MRKSRQFFYQKSNHKYVPSLEEILAMKDRNLFQQAPPPTDRYMKAIDFVRLFLRSETRINSRTIERGVRMGFLEGKFLKKKGLFHRDKKRNYYCLVKDSQVNRDAIDRRVTWRRVHKVRMKSRAKYEKPLRFERLTDAFMEPFVEQWVSIEEFFVDDEIGPVLYPHSVFPLGFLVDYDIIDPDELKPLREVLMARLKDYLEEQGYEDVKIATSPFYEGQMVNIQPILTLGKHVCRVEKSTRDGLYFFRWQIFGKDPTPFSYQINLGEYMPK